MTDQQTTRTIKKVWKSEPTLEGAGVHLKRAFGFQDPQLFDPFLLLDDFRSDTPADYLAGFPWHPHRGMETITYVLDGVVEHQDSLGHGGQIGSGDVQWMTAGSGILHQEMPKGSNSGRMYGFQLWANLPASQKMMDPRYRDVRHDTVPLINNGDGAEIRLIAGRVGEIDGPVQDIVTEPEYMDISLKPGTEFVRQVDPRHTVFAYVVDGEGYFEPGRDATHANKATLHGNGSLVLYGPGDSIRVTAEHNPVRFLLATGKPIGEPIAWGGPIVMNTREELRTAFEDLDKGTFIKVRG